MAEKFSHMPEEARDFDMKKQAEKFNEYKPPDKTILQIQQGPDAGKQASEAGVKPDATGERIHWRNPDGNVITPEKEEIYRSPETLTEKEPGYGPKASLSDDPGQIPADDQTQNSQATDVPDDD